MRLKVDTSALEKAMNKKTAEVAKRINRKTAGKSPQEAARIAERELRKEGITPNKAGIRELFK